MNLKHSKKFISFSLFIASICSLFNFNKTNNSNDNYISDNKVIEVNNFDDLEIEKETDDYSYNNENNIITVNASKSYSSSLFDEIEELSDVKSNYLKVDYSIRYDMNNYDVYLNNSFIDNMGNTIYQNEIKGYPVYNEDNENDVVFLNDDNTTVYLSELVSEKESCFIGSLFLSALAYKIVKAVLASAIVLCTAIIVSGVVYKLVKADNSTLAQAQSIAKEEEKKNKRIYFMAKIQGGFLMMDLTNPMNMYEASTKMQCEKASFYTPLGIDAYNVCKIAGGGLLPAKAEYHREGYFYHYHPANHIPDVHCWFGLPVYKTYVI